MSNQDNPADDSCPETVEAREISTGITIDRVANDTFQISFGGASFAHLIVDLRTTDELDPELRVYPDGDVGGDPVFFVTSLPGTTPRDDTEPTVVEADDTVFDFYIRIPTRDGSITPVAVTVGDAQPYLATRNSDDVEFGAGYSGFLMTTESNE